MNATISAPAQLDRALLDAEWGPARRDAAALDQRDAAPAAPEDN